MLKVFSVEIKNTPRIPMLTRDFQKGVVQVSLSVLNSYRVPGPDTVLLLTKNTQTQALAAARVITPRG